jgi:hypothetical protein
VPRRLRVIAERGAPEKAEDLTLAYLQVEPVDGRHPAEAFGQSFRLDRIVDHGRLPVISAFARSSDETTSGDADKVPLVLLDQTAGP